MTLNHLTERHKGLFIEIIGFFEVQFFKLLETFYVSLLTNNQSVYKQICELDVYLHLYNMFDEEIKKARNNRKVRM